MSSTKSRVVQKMAWVLAGIIGIACLAYLTDFAILRWKFNHNSDAFATVRIRPYYAVPRKDHKLEFMFQDPVDESCVNSLFPHGGSSPCWYLKKHHERRVDL